jgi:hypothetical protein
VENKKPNQVTITITVPRWFRGPRWNRTPRWAVLISTVVLVAVNRIDLILQLMQYWTTR